MKVAGLLSYAFVAATHPYLALEFLQLTLDATLKTPTLCVAQPWCFSVWWEVSCRLRSVAVC